MSIDSAIEGTAPAWRKVQFPATYSVWGRDEVTDDLLLHIADRDRVERAIDTVTDHGYWIDRAQLDRIQQDLFGGPEAEPQAHIPTPEEKDAAAEGFVAELADAKEKNERLRGEVNKLTVELTNVQKDFDEFKTKVVRVASEYATEHDWCAVVDEALGELGLKREPQTYGATLTITVKFTGTLKDRRETVTDDWVAQSLTGISDIRSHIRDSLGLDSDHDDIDVDGISWEVTDVENGE